MQRKPSLEGSPHGKQRHTPAQIGRFSTRFPIHCTGQVPGKTGLQERRRAMKTGLLPKSS
jgi:hypothetical protein